MALLGFTLGFGARDEGADNALRNTNKSVTRLFDSMEEGSERAGKAASHMWEMFQSVQLMEISGQITDAFGQVGNLTTGLEAEFVAMDVEARKVTATLGLFGSEGAKARGKIAGLAKSLNTDAGTVAQSFQALELEGDSVGGALDALGVDLAGLVKAQVGLGIETKGLLDNVADLTQSWGFSDEAAANLIDTYTHVATQAGIGSIAFEQFGQNAEKINEILAQSGKAISPENIAEAQVGIAKLAGAFTDLGESPEKAAAGALQLFEALTGEMINQEKMVSGLGGEYGDFFTGIVKEGGFKTAEEMFQLDPTKGMEALTRLEDKIREAGNPEQLSRFHANLTAINPSLSFLAQNSDKTRAALARMGKVAGEDASGAFKKMTKEGFSTGRTLADSYQLMQDSFEMRIRKMGTGARDFMKQSRKAFKIAGDAVEAYSNNPAWSGIVTTALNYDRMGVAGLFTSIAKSADSVSTPIENLDSVFGRLSTRFKLFREIGLQALFVDLDLAATNMEEAINKSRKSMEKLQALFILIGGPGKMLIGIIAGIGGSLAAIGLAMKPLKAVFTPFGELLKSFGKSMTKSVAAPVKGAGKALGLFGKLGMKVLTPLGNLFAWFAPTLTRFGGKFTKALGPVAKVAGRLISTLGFRGGLGFVFRSLGKLLFGWPMLVAQAGLLIAKHFDKIKEFVFKWGEKLLSWMGDKMSDVWNSLTDIDGAQLAKDVVGGIKNFFSKIGELFSGGGMESEAGQKFKAAMVKVIEEGFDIAKEIGRIGKEFASEIGKMIMSVDWSQEASNLALSLEGMIDKGIEKLSDFDPMEFAATISVKFREMLQGIFSGKEGDPGIDWGKVLIAAIDVGRVVGKIAWFIGSVFVKAFQLSVSLMANGLALLGEGLISLFGGLYDITIVPMSEHLAEILFDAFPNAIQKFDEYVRNPFNNVLTFFSELGAKFTGFFTGEGGILTIITGFGERMKEAGMSLVTSIGDGINESWTSVKDGFSTKLDDLQAMLPWNSPAEDGPMQDGGGLFGAGKNFFDEIWGGMQSYFPTLLGGFTDSLRNLSIQGIEALKEPWRVGLGAMFEEVNMAVANNLAYTAGDAVAGYVMGAFDKAKKLVRQLEPDLISLVKGKVLEASLEASGDANFDLGNLEFDDKNFVSLGQIIAREGKETRKVLERIDGRLANQSVAGTARAIAGQAPVANVG